MSSSVWTADTQPWFCEQSTPLLRKAQQLIEGAFARAVEAGQAGLALERHVIDRRLAVAHAGRARVLEGIGEAAAQLLAGLVGARLQGGVAAQLQRRDGRGGRQGIGV